MTEVCCHFLNLNWMIKTDSKQLQLPVRLIHIDGCKIYGKIKIYTLTDNTYNTQGLDN